MNAAERSRNSSRLQKQARRLREVALELLQMAADMVPEDRGKLEHPAQSSPDRDASLFFQSERSSLLGLATKTYRLRRKRDRFFPALFFGEPAWDLLLDLYAHDAKGKQVSVSSACLAAATPATTALRWIRILEANGYVTRLQDRSDSRVTFLQLTDLARTQLELYFSQLEER